MKAVLFSIAAGVAVAAPVPQLIAAPVSTFGCGGYFQLSGLANTCGSISTAMGITPAELAIYNPGVITTGCADLNAVLPLTGIQSLCARQLTPSVAAVQSYSSFGLQVIAPGAPFDQYYLAMEANALTLSAASITSITRAEFSLYNRQLFLNPLLSGVTDVSSLLITPAFAQTCGIADIASVRQIESVAITPGSAQISRVQDVAGVSNIGTAAYVPGSVYGAGLSNIAGYNNIANIAAVPGSVYGAGVADVAGLRNIANVAAVPGSVYGAGVADVAGLRNIASQAINPGAADIAGVADVGGVASNAHIAVNPGAWHQGGVTDLRSPIVARQIANVASNAHAAQIDQVAANPGAISASRVTDVGQTTSLNTAWPMSIFGANVFGLAPYTSLSALTLPYGSLVTGFDILDSYLAFNSLQTASICAIGSSYRFLWNTLDSQLACAGGQLYSARFQMVQAAQAVAGVY